MDKKNKAKGQCPLSFYIFALRKRYILLYGREFLNFKKSGGNLMSIKRTLKKAADKAAGAALGATTGIAVGVTTFAATTAYGASHGAKDSIRSFKKGWNESRKERSENSKR